MPLRLRACAPALWLALGLQPAVGHGNDGLLPGSTQRIDPAWMAVAAEQLGERPAWANRLALAESAYLRQHADNPIDWYPWAEPAFDLARRENRLILLSIGYASCHWCHVMERESFANPGVAAVLNRRFVSVKVDRELQPDIDAHFTRVVQSLRGESGWPITVILTPDKRPIFGANYLTSEQLTTVAQRLAEQWAADPAVLVAQADLLEQAIGAGFGAPASVAGFDDDWLKLAAERLLETLDDEFGGFGQGPKFPGEVKLQFLLDRFKENPSNELHKALEMQLDRLMTSGLVDVVNGGIFRYTTDRAMTRPHFEKMLYNQALTVRLFAEAADWLGQPRYAVLARRVMDFVEADMRLEDGTLAAALDAEHLGEEGGYYLWEEDRVTRRPQGLAAVQLPAGGWYLYGDAGAPGAPAFLDRLRASRPDAARRIDNSITAWNALWVTALVSVNELERAEQLATRLWDKYWDGAQLWRSRTQPGFLDDYSFLSAAVWRLYLATGQEEWKTRGEQLDRAMLERFTAGGELRYAPRAADTAFEVDPFRDSEWPAPAAPALAAFAGHQADAAFVQALARLEGRAHAAVAQSPAEHAALLQVLAGPLPGTAHSIAQGHGRISVAKAGPGPAWRLDIQLDEGWHVNAARVLDPRLVPTGISASGAGLVVDYPEGHLFQSEFSDAPLLVYDGLTSITITLPGWGPDRAVAVTLQACSSQVCLLPETFILKPPVFSRPTNGQ